MKFGTSLAVAYFLFTGAALAEAKTEILRQAVISNGLTQVEDLQSLSEMADVGKLIFESKALSLNANISCEQCHLNEFGTADGIPLAVGVSGEGTGSERVKSAYRFLARNTQALWGRGAESFKTFFWDGRVDVSDGEIVSQFGAAIPSSDPLAVAVHLPPVETIEMLKFDDVIDQYLEEDIDSAQRLYALIADHLKKNEPSIAARLSKVVNIESESITFDHLATSLAACIGLLTETKN
jgi:cytochrome c peroxidase